MTTEAERALQLERALERPGAVDEEIGRLLEQVQALRRLAPPSPPRAYIAATRFRLLNRLQARSTSRPKPAERRRAFTWPRLRRSALALASLLLATLLLFSGTGIAYAASASLPGDPLYGVKRGYERVQLTLTFQDQARLQLLHQYTNQRLAEIQALHELKRTGDLPAALANYSQSVEELTAALGEGSPTQFEGVQQSLDHNNQVLQAVLETAPASAVPGLENALEKTSHSVDVLEALAEGRSPSEQAPGQLKKTETEPSPSDADEHVPPGQEKKSSPGPPGGTPPGQLKKTGTPGPPPDKGPPGDRGGD